MSLYNLALILVMNWSYSHLVYFVVLCVCVPFSLTLSLPRGLPLHDKQNLACVNSCITMALFVWLTFLVDLNIQKALCYSKLLLYFFAFPSTLSSMNITTSLRGIIIIAFRFNVSDFGK